MPIKGYSSLDVSERDGLGLSNLPKVKQSVAQHLHPNRRTTLSSASSSIPGKMEHFTASIPENINKSLVLAVLALNITSYYYTVIGGAGTQMDTSNPNPAVWEVICNITDLNLCTSRGAVQSSGRTMALAFLGERSLWLNFSSIGDWNKFDFFFKKKHCILLLRCRTKFFLCIQDCKTPELRAGDSAASNTKPWRKQSFAVAAPKSRSANPSKKKRRGILRMQYLLWEGQTTPRVFCDVLSRVHHVCSPSRKEEAENVDFGW